MIGRRLNDCESRSSNHSTDSRKFRWHYYHKTSGRCWEDDNKPIGIILCTDKDALTAEYALGGLSNNIFASKYTYYIPDKEQLIAEVEKIIKKLED
jgi:YhcG PDDEXK nuclease domain